MRPSGALCSALAAALLVPTHTLGAVDKPHIVFIVADDLGWNDVGFRSHQIATPNIDDLAARGVTLDQYYVQSVCSPSRCTFLSGYFPNKHGVQDWIPPASSYGLPLNLTTLPEQLASAGYDARAVGKWHAGFFKWAYTPTFRGFNSFLGFYSGGEDYFKHLSSGAYDFRHDPSPTCGQGCSRVLDARGNYSTTVFTTEAVRRVMQHDTSDPTKPLFLYLAYQAVHAPREVPQSYVDPYVGKIADSDRREFAGMLTAMDEGIGNVTQALKAKGMLEDTLIVFTTDNGGPVPDTPGGDYVGSNNFPLRGGKHSIWEGGTRGTAVIAGAGIKTAGAVHRNMMHAADWLPTLVQGVAGVAPRRVGESSLPLDGVNQWAGLADGGASPPVRQQFMYGHHDDAPQSGVDNALRIGKWKLINGTGGKPSSWSTMPNASTLVPAAHGFQAASAATRAGVGEAGPNGTYELYDVQGDPSERHDVSGSHPDVVERLAQALAAAIADGVPAAKDDPACPSATHPVDPAVGKVWAPWC